METVNVTDEFECHRKCIQNNTCKSFNVHPPRRNTVQKTCEMNNQTRQMIPKQYKKKIGSSYHGSVEVSFNLPLEQKLLSWCFFSKVVTIRVLKEFLQQNPFRESKGVNLSSQVVDLGFDKLNYYV